MTWETPGTNETRGLCPPPPRLTHVDGGLGWAPGWQGDVVQPSILQGGDGVGVPRGATWLEMKDGSSPAPSPSPRCTSATPFFSVSSLGQCGGLTRCDHIKRTKCASCVYVCKSVHMCKCGTPSSDQHLPHLPSLPPLISRKSASRNEDLLCPPIAFWV